MGKRDAERGGGEKVKRKIIRGKQWRGKDRVGLGGEINVGISKEVERGKRGEKKRPTKRRKR